VNQRLDLPLVTIRDALHGMAGNPLAWCCRRDLDMAGVANARKLSSIFSPSTVSPGAAFEERVASPYATNL
jgi:hypothetical protein